MLELFIKLAAAEEEQRAVRWCPAYQRGKHLVQPIKRAASDVGGVGGRQMLKALGDHLSLAGRAGGAQGCPASLPHDAKLPPGG